MNPSKTLLAALLSIASLGALAERGDLVEIRVEDRDGRPYREYRAFGNSHIAGEYGEPYQIRLRNLSRERLLVVLSVDGVNAVSGQTAGYRQSGYVLDPWQSTTVIGWRKSLSSAAQFYFTDLGDSYASRTGRPDDVGVIGAAVFQEKRRWLRDDDRVLMERSDAPSSPSAKAQGRPAPQARLGTGHGDQESSYVERTTFERASERPYETLAIRYDSRRNLRLAGVIREREDRRRDWRDEPRAFPAEGFVADPPGHNRTRREEGGK